MCRRVKRLEVAFRVFNVPDELKLPYLLHFMGPEAPNSPEDRAYNEVVQVMDQFYNPRPSEIAEIFLFQSRKQQEGESVQEYYYALQKLSISCQFEECLKIALRNQFVYGFHSRCIQSILLETRDVTLDRNIYKCGDTQHFVNKCNMINLTCNFCKREGHLQRDI
nr:unnamed protein product [Callosobruchus analis]